MLIMSAGPTHVPDRVRKAMVKNFTNTDLDPEYIRFHRECEKKVSKVLNTEAKSFLMLGEAMLGLDGACASFVEKGDRVLVIVNGIFSEGFADFVRMYGGEPVVYESDRREGIDVEDLKEFLEMDHDFVSATMVHCETPSGLTNDIDSICRLLNSYGILSIVDSVSGMGGEYIDFDHAGIDCIIGGTQKCFSSPPGLTTITLSEKAISYLENRGTAVSSFYGNFQNYIKSGEFEFPYTPCPNLVYAFDEALNITLSHDFTKRHREFAEKTRIAVRESGLELFPLNSFSNTVSSVLMPEGKSSNVLLERMLEKGIIISGGMGDLNGKAFRIGHMGSNIENTGDYILMLRKLSEALSEMDIQLKGNLADLFIKA